MRCICSSTNFFFLTSKQDFRIISGRKLAITRVCVGSSIQIGVLNNRGWCLVDWQMARVGLSTMKLSVPPISLFLNGVLLIISNVLPVLPVAPLSVPTASQIFKTAWNEPSEINMCQTQFVLIIITIPGIIGRHYQENSIINKYRSRTLCQRSIKHTSTF